MTRPTAMAPDASTSPVGHTPGPWVVGVSVDNGIHCVDAENPNGVTIEIAEVWGIAVDTEEGPESHANARLIAAGPELLAALEALLADCGEVMSDGYVENSIHSDEVAIARAAVAKARGEVA